MSKSVLVINGPNLNLLGSRETNIYGRTTLEEIARLCRQAASARSVEVSFLQSNHEGQLVTWIQEAIGSADAIVINAAAYTHTSVAVHDALRAYPGLKIELHISNPHARESYRHVSFIAPVVDAVICGLGTYGYELAVSFACDRIHASNG